MEMIIAIIKIRTLIMQMPLRIHDYFECFNCQPISLRNHAFKKQFRNAIRAPNSLDPDQVPYFVGPDLRQKCLQSSRYHEQS